MAKSPVTKRATGPTRRARTTTAASAKRKSPARVAHAKAEARDSHGRFRTGHGKRNAALALGGGVIALGAGLAAAVLRGWVRMPRGPWADAVEGDAAPDLALDAPKPGTKRAPKAFRPDPTAIPNAMEAARLAPPPGEPVIAVAD